MPGQKGDTLRVWRPTNPSQSSLPPTQPGAEQPAAEQAAEAVPEKAPAVEAGLTTLLPEDVTSTGLPVTMRGYDRERVDRLLTRVREAYALTLQQCQTLRDGQRSLKAELEAAEGEASASARSVAELMRRSATVEDQLVQMREERADLEARLELAESDREQALSDLHEAVGRASDLGRRLESFENGELPPEHVEATIPQTAAAAADGEAAQLLVAAARAAEDVRTASRARALHTLTKARDLAALVQAQTEREQAALVATQERRDEIEREANRVLARAQAEADSFVMAIEDERRRVRELLTGALVSLDSESTSPPESLMTDLESRLHETTEPTTT